MAGRQGHFGRAGLVVDGRYRLEDLLGSGGFGEVWRATQQVEGESVRQLALKLLSAPPVSGTPGSDGAAGWLNEVRAVRAIRCEAVATVYDVGVARDTSLAYIAMELLSGETLADRLARGPIYWRRALWNAARIADALSACHEVGVAHCDLKPANVFLDRTGRVCVLDFGIAALSAEPGNDAPPGELLPDAEVATGVVRVEDVPEGAGVSTSRTLIGTLGYIAPEVYAGDAPGPASDVYSLGVVLYESIFAALPYVLPDTLPGDRRSTTTADRQKLNAAIGTATVRGDLISPRARDVDVPPALVELLESCLALNPSERPRDDLVGRLEDVWKRPYGVPDPPYVGLEAFDHRRTGYIDGRSADVASVASKLQQTRGIVLAGPSGCGKSSLALAGVAARLDEELVGGLDGWRSVVVRPTQSGAELGAAPDGEVETGARVGTLVVVDQLEEVLGIAEDRRDAFCDALATLAEGTGKVAVRGRTFDGDSPVRVVATVRDDLFGRVASIPSLRRFPEQNLYTVRGVEPNAIASIVVHPAKRAGYEPEQASEVVSEARRLLKADPSALPLVQFALTRWWEERDTVAHVLPHSAWTRIGGVEGALADAAQSLYDALGAEDQGRLRRAFLELFRPDGTRKRTAEAALVEDPAMRRLLERRDVRRLVRRVVDSDEQAMLEAVHEALARRWPLLRRWLEETRNERELLEEVAYDAQRWHRANEPEEMLWGGARLAAANELGDRLAVGADFIEAANRFANRKRRRARLRIGVAFAALGAALLVTGWLYLSAREARDEAETARGDAEAARADAEQAKADAEKSRNDSIVLGSKLDLANKTAERARTEQKTKTQELERRQHELDAATQALDAARKQKADPKKLERLEQQAKRLRDEQKKMAEQALREAARAKKAERRYREAEQELRRLRESEGIGEPTFP